MNILVLCTGNSARSILLETLLNLHGNGRLAAYSTGSKPTGTVNPGAIELLERMNYPKQQARSKSWDEFAGVDAPNMDFVITVCDNAAGETCPIWPGQPIRHHYGIADPAHFEGAARAEAFRVAYLELMEFTTRFLMLPLESASYNELRAEISKIKPRTETRS